MTVKVAEEPRFVVLLVGCVVMAGDWPTVKLVELVALPPGVARAILPVVAPEGTTAVAEVAFSTVKELAAVPLNFTDVVPMKLVPVMVTVVPTPPLLGLKLVSFGAGTKVKVELLVAVPPEVVTLILPVEAEAGTTAVILVGLLITKLLAPTPLNFTALAPVKLLPSRITEVPAPPRAGVKLLMAGLAAGARMQPEAIPQVTKAFIICRSMEDASESSRAMNLALQEPFQSQGAADLA
ncbi:hypothetical protein [Mesoterricola sediminis]|uniref:hypothetical protein n=1 Tax=Mesoterricola sediminis TaxID=2927980 RepID=UPI00292E4EA9|nr:hypothetical protein [Mesoterricola sediminis]